MIDPKRRLHFRLWVLAALSLPLILVGTYRAQSEQTASDIPSGLRPADESSGSVLAADILLSDKLDYQVIQTDTDLVLILHQRAPLKIPDVLIYVASEAGDERLIGSVGSAQTQTFPLGLDAETAVIHLSLYSLGHQETLVELDIQLEKAR